MKRPLLLRVLPERLRLPAYYRLYSSRRSTRYAPLYNAAPLAYAPQLTMRLSPGDAIGDSIAFTGVYDAGMSRRLAALARQGGLMVDVGANLGYFSLVWAAARPDNRVIAYEASPRIAPLLRENVARNGLDAQIDVRARAAGDVAGMTPFVLGPAEQTGWGGLAAARDDGTVDVPVVRLDEELADAGPIAMLKVDAEGSDALVIRGCAGLLAQRLVAELWFEENLVRMAALAIPAGAAERTLRAHGYRVSDVGDGAYRAVPEAHHSPVSAAIAS